MELTLECKKVIVGFLVEALEPQIIYLYGSFAKAEGRTDSDIDVAILYRSGNRRLQALSPSQPVCNFSEKRCRTSRLKECLDGVPRTDNK